MVGSPVVPRILSVPGSSVSLTVMARLVSDRGLFRNKSRISENGVGLIRLSGCIISKIIDKFKRVDVFRLVASVSIECANMGIVAIGGIGIGWDEGLETLYSLGRMGKGVHYSYHKQRPQFSEGVDGPTGPAPNSTKG